MSNEILLLIPIFAYMFANEINNFKLDLEPIKEFYKNYNKYLVLILITLMFLFAYFGFGRLDLIFWFGVISIIGMITNTIRIREEEAKEV